VPGAVKLDFRCVRTHWNRGFICVPAGPYIWIVILLTPMWPESGFLVRGTQSQPLAKRYCVTAISMGHQCRCQRPERVTGGVTGTDAAAGTRNDHNLHH
jgi:hypothetical protein